MTPFAADIRRSLSLWPRQVPSRYFYDALGSALFDAICELPWYRITRAETGLLTRHGPEILDAAAPLGRVIELGSGSGAKLAVLLGGRDSNAAPLNVTLIDVSRAALDTATRSLNQLRAIDVETRQAPYEHGLAGMAAETWTDGRTLMAFLGSNIGNFDPPAAADLLVRIRAALQPKDLLLLGTDLVKPEADLLLAYADPLGVTAAFNLNIIARMNRELEATFDLTALRHVALWNATASRVEMHVEAVRRQHVDIPAADLTFTLEPGERIWTESSYKFRPESVAALLAHAHFRQTRQWIDDGAGFALTIAEAY
ncbi:MAG: L-histidine N(alpha)-methyltransferase [Vicinamibacterales bacterium]